MTCRLCLLVFVQAPVTQSRCLHTSSSVDPRLIALRTLLFHVVLSFERDFCHVKTARFVLSCQLHENTFAWNSRVCLNVSFVVYRFSSMRFLLSETSLLLLLSLFWALRLLPVKTFASGTLLCLPFFLQPSAARGCRTSKACRALTRALYGCLVMQVIQMEYSCRQITSRQG